MKKVIILLAVVLCSCASRKTALYKVDLCPVKWANDIHNPENDEFVGEVAFNLGISKDEVTQEQFNRRYVDDNYTAK